MSQFRSVKNKDSRDHFSRTISAAIVTISIPMTKLLNSVVKIIHTVFSLESQESSRNKVNAH